MCFEWGHLGWQQSLGFRVHSSANLERASGLFLTFFPCLPAE